MNNRELAEKIIDCILVELGFLDGVGDELEAMDTEAYDELEEELTKKTEQLLDGAK